MIALVIALALVGASLLAMPRLFIGPTLHDRALAATALMTRAALAAAALAASRGDVAGVDVAIALVLAVFVVHVAILKFFRVHSMQPPLARLGAE